jgi:hypothetical protein
MQWHDSPPFAAVKLSQQTFNSAEESFCKPKMWNNKKVWRWGMKSSLTNKNLPEIFWNRGKASLFGTNNVRHLRVQRVACSLGFAQEE